MLILYIYFLKVSARKTKQKEESEAKMTALEKKLKEKQSDKGFYNHQNGHAFELKNHNIERRNSILSIHSDGSYGKIDIATFRKDYVLLIVCKVNGYIEPKERRELDKLKEKFSTLNYKCRIQLRYKIGRKMHKTWY